MTHRFLVRMVNGFMDTDSIEVEAPDAGAAMLEAEWRSATCTMCAWHESPWRAVSSVIIGEA